MPDQRADIERLNERGAGLLDVGQILDGEERTTLPSPARFSPPRLEGTPELPEPGLYFGMSDEEYHALPALSNHGIKYLAASPMIFWSRTPWLSEKRALEVREKLLTEASHHVLGKAYHCRIMEGSAEFARRFVVELDPADFPNALVHSDQIKAAIGRHKEMVPVKPCSARKDELTAQLIGLTTAPASTVEGMKVDDLKAAIRQYKVEQPVKPWAKVTDTLPGTDEPYERQAVKADWIRQLLELEPDAEIFDVLQQRFLLEHDGKTVISFGDHLQLETAARMVEQDPELIEAFKDGYAEVVLIWYCEKTGVPMKAKLDYLKIDEIVDLKTIANQRNRAIETAIRYEIASYHYNFQPIVYFEGVEEVRKIVRKHGASAVHGADEEKMRFALKWAKNVAPVDFLWVFQQKGDAPITRGVRFPRTGITHEDTDFHVDRAKRLFIQYSEVYGTDPWLDIKPVYTIADEDIPRSATEL